MTYYPVNSSMILPNNSTSSTTMSHGNQPVMVGGHHLTSGLPHSGIPTPPGAPTSHMGLAGPGPSGGQVASAKTLTMSHHHMNLLNPRPSDFHANFGTVHRSQKIYLQMQHQQDQQQQYECFPSVKDRPITRGYTQSGIPRPDRPPTHPTLPAA